MRALVRPITTPSIAASSSQTRNGTGRIINCVAANGTARCERNGGGYPNLAENRRALTLPANPNEVTASGYTNLELWLQRHGGASRRSRAELLRKRRR